jgi:dolichol-phosphate mannosyltransferase
VILSVYNEADNLSAVYEELAGVAEREPDLDWEFVFVNDGSIDGSLALLRRLNTRDPRVKVISFARNFGPHETSMAGLRACAGDAAILMGADLQDPPRLIHEFLRRWRDGHDLVLGVRAGRADSPWRGWAARLFTSLVRRIALPNFPRRGTGGYCLLSRKVIDAYNGLDERNRLTTGLLLWLGFEHVEVPYERARRHAGRSRYVLPKLVKTALDMLLAFSMTPLRLVSLLGVCSFLVGTTGALFVLTYALVYGFQVVGWASLVVLILILGGLQLLALGVLGEYQWRILDEVRGRPHYLVHEWIGDFAHDLRRDSRAGPRAA